MIKALIAFGSGFLFGIGLIVAQMTNPAKILNFLDIAGHWDASLAFVMLGAIPIAAVGFALARRRKRPMFAEKFQLPTTTVLDARLVAGAALFGFGWGLVGLCPGPALVALGFGRIEALLFVAAMIVGMLLFQLADATVLKKH